MQYGTKMNNIRGEGGNVENRRVQMEESDNHTEHYKWQDKASSETRYMLESVNVFTS